MGRSPGYRQGGAGRGPARSSRPPASTRAPPPPPEIRSKNSPKKLATPEGNSQLGSNCPNSKAPENSLYVRRRTRFATPFTPSRFSACAASSTWYRVRVCVRESERECVFVCERECRSGCVCVCVRERERKGGPRSWAGDAACLTFRGPWSLGNLNLVDYFPLGSQAFYVNCQTLFHGELPYKL